MDPRPTRLHELWAPWAPALAIVDVCSAYFGALLASFILDRIGYMPLWPLHEAFHLLVLVVTGVTPLWLHAANAYRPWRGQSLTLELRLVTTSWLSVFLLFSAFAFFTKTGAAFSRVWMSTWFVITLILLIAARIVLRTILRHIRERGLDIKNVVLVGGGELGRHVMEVLNINKWTGLSVLGHFDDRARESLGNCPRLGAFNDLGAYLDSNDVDQVWVALPLSAEKDLRKILDELRYRSVDVRLVPDIRSYQLLNHSVETIAGMPVLNLSTSPHVGLDRFAKRLMDIVGSGIGLLLLSPILLLLALFIRMDSKGPVFFLQLRHGWDGKPFRVFKFRSMHVQPPVSNGPYKQATRNDSRITRAGKWLRRTNLDELPQLLNVFLGDMSLVGPRPHPVEMNRIYQQKVDRYMLRHRVRPGMTGWAQVHGYRGETDTLEKIQGRIEHDLYYIEHWSIMLDIQILFLTVLRGFRDPNAY